jgi:DnaJ-domain-containing protein 1
VVLVDTKQETKVVDLVDHMVALEMQLEMKLMAMPLQTLDLVEVVDVAVTEMAETVHLELFLLLTQHHKYLKNLKYGSLR